MKEKLNFARNILIILYILLIIFITICLLSYNDYKVTEFGNTTILPVIDENLEPEYSVGDLLILKKNISDISVGDTIFFYRSTFGTTVVNFAKVVNIEIVTTEESTITVEGDYMFSSQYLIGKASTATIVPLVGHVISLLESKYGFLFLGVLPSLIIFLYTGYTLFLEVRVDEDDEDDEEDKEVPKKSKKQIKNQPKEKSKIEKVDQVEEKELQVEEKIEIEKIDKQEKYQEEKENNEKVETLEESPKEENNEIKFESVKTPAKEVRKDTKVPMTEEQKKALIEEKMKSMTEEQKKALIEAKLKTMTEEQKKALLEAKRKKLQENK